MASFASIGALRVSVNGRRGAGRRCTSLRDVSVIPRSRSPDYLLIIIRASTQSPDRHTHREAPSAAKGAGRSQTRWSNIARPSGRVARFRPRELLQLGAADRNWPQQEQHGKNNTTTDRRDSDDAWRESGHYACIPAGSLVKAIYSPPIYALDATGSNTHAQSVRSPLLAHGVYSVHLWAKGGGLANEFT